jgi:hypothetical protein
MHVGEPLGEGGAAVLSPTVEDVEGDRVLAEIEVGLGLQPDVLAKRLREVPVPSPHASVPVVDRRRHGGMELAAWTAEGDEPFDIARVEGRDGLAMELDVLRHPTSSISLVSASPQPCVARCELAP